IIGMPNAGKSTLISAISSARPKIADYPFTTLTPSLGMVQPGFGEPFAVADIPGLIEGAHEGSGLGIQFLKHVERTGILLHLIDASRIDPQSPLESLNLINRELALYSPLLVKKKQLVVLNKMDLTGTEHRASVFKEAYADIHGSSPDISSLPKACDILTISAATGTGTRELVKELARRIGSVKE
ncbi:MAG: 50S ribosome-binding GTPase, partial [Desulfamplus sp.]|nr:50S ribosome-binding GTPase [Desulfamplus sp.]